MNTLVLISDHAAQQFHPQSLVGMETAILSIKGNIQVNLSSAARSLTPPPDPEWKRVCVVAVCRLLDRLLTRGLRLLNSPPTLLEVGMKVNGRGCLLHLMAGSLRVALFLMMRLFWRGPC